MRNFIKLTLVFVFIFSIASISQAQDTISTEKKKLIAELIILTKAGAQTAEITDTLLESMERTYPLIIKQSLSKYNQLSKAEQDILSDRLTKSYKKFNKRFREELPKAIDYDQYVNDAVYPLYDKFFTEKELADIVAFYKTETGQKVVITMPKLAGELTKISEKLLVPKILELIDRLINEDINNLEHELTKEDG